MPTIENLDRDILVKLDGFALDPYLRHFVRSRVCGSAEHLVLKTCEQFPAVASVTEGTTPIEGGTKQDPDRNDRWFPPFTGVPVSGY
jgi:hypothetical protein